MWNEHSAAGFPEDVAGEEIDGVDLVLTDTFAAGCIDTFLGNKGTLAVDRVKILRKCVSDLEKVCPSLNGEASVYFVRLSQIGRMVLNEARIR